MPGKILARITGAGIAEDADIILEKTSRDLKQEINLDINQLLKIPDDQLINLFDVPEKRRREYLETLADILYQLAESLVPEEHNRVVMDSLYSRSLFLYEYLNTTGPVYSLERQILIGKIRNLLGSSG
ncbi:MAG: hypothetical protein KFF73_09710 [Cyclobacteriaceae bacterium]|nr:hypothetical protein [Cyclobacteriaceae bacterium]